MKESQHTQLSRFNETTKPDIPRWSLEATGGRRTIVQVGKLAIGGSELVVIAGPCSVESKQQIMELAQLVSEAGAQGLRGGAFKPRTNPDSFQGLEVKGLEFMREAADKYGLVVVTEATGQDNVGIVAELADVIQIGSRNGQNYELIAAAAKTMKPILLKRCWSSTVEELLGAAEYVLGCDNFNVALCERGIRTAVGTILDVNAVIKLKRKTHLPVIIDPSHSAQDRNLVRGLTRAGIVVGADGAIIEAHNHPEIAKSDGQQAVSTEVFSTICRDIAALAPFLERSFALPVIQLASNLDGGI